MRLFVVAALLAAAASAHAQTCVAIYGQCGGASYTGVTTCCSGSSCVYSNDWYSQCLASSGTTSAASSSAATSTTTTRASTTTSSTTTTRSSTTTTAAASSSTTTTTRSSTTTTRSSTTTSAVPSSSSTTTTRSSTTTSAVPSSSSTTTTRSSTTTTRTTTTAAPTSTAVSGTFDPRPACNAVNGACTPCCGYGLSCVSGICQTNTAAGAPTHWIAPPARPTGGAPSAPAGYKPVWPFSTSGRHIVDANGYRFKLTGVNWFGGETSIKAPHGLWGPAYRETIDHMKAMGFTVLRLPYGNSMLDAGAVTSSMNSQTNPDLIGLSPIEVFDALIAYAGSIGMFVILDRHTLAADQRTALWYSTDYPESRWISDWEFLATRYANNKFVIGADLHNEPYGAVCWGCGDPLYDWKAAAIKAGNAVLAKNPNWLIIVEGVQSYNGNSTDSTWWGGNLGMAALQPITLNVPNKVVYSPHEYGASVYTQNWFLDPTFPQNLPTVWYHYWGHLWYNNVAPILLGEFGSTLADPADTVWMTKLIEFMGAGDDGMSWTYWSWNPDSGDTGGLVTYDWVTEETAKVNIIKPAIWNWY